MSLSYGKPSYMYFYICKEDNLVDKTDYEALVDALWIYPKENEPIRIWFGYHDWDYGEDNFYLLYKPYDKLQFAYTCLFNDKEIDALVKSWFPDKEVVIEKSYHRRGFPLAEQLEKYNISLEDFILNGKYIVVLDDGCHWGEMSAHGLIDFNKFTDETADQDIYW